MVKIGITKTDWEDKHLNYVHWIKGNSKDVEVVTLSKDDIEKIDDCDGFVLSGGVDIHPKYYNGKQGYDNAPTRFNTERDDFEFSLLSKAIEAKRPVLGVCRGLQLINVFCNGTLVQDMGNQNDIHTDDQNDKTHMVEVSSGTMLADIVGEKSGIVNSAHHQSIDKLGQNLVANSFSKDGTIEGIEWKENKTFILAVQWHPERMDKSQLVNSPFSKNIRDHFIERVKSNSEK